jgi:hypothetical protein
MGEIMGWLRPVTRLALPGMLLGGLALGTALADANDDLAESIGKSLDTIAVQKNAQPELAVAGLAEQQRQLDDLAKAAPTYPELANLRRRIAELDRQLMQPDSATAVAAPPVDIARLLGRLRAQLRQVEGARLSKNDERATTILEEVEAALTDLRRDRSDEIPQGHVAAFVLEERIAVLKQQLAADALAPAVPRL